jgi:hypothetical protein
MPQELKKVNGRWQLVGDDHSQDHTPPPPTPGPKPTAKAKPKAKATCYLKFRSPTPLWKWLWVIKMWTLMWLCYLTWSEYAVHPHVSTVRNNLTNCVSTV